MIKGNHLIFISYNRTYPGPTIWLIMGKYNFYQDTKCVIWQRQHFTVEAESYEKAVMVAEKFKTQNIGASDESYLITDTEYNSESCEMLEVHENDYKATCELYNEIGEMMGSNLDGCVPDDDFLFDRLIRMLQVEYFKPGDDFNRQIDEYAVKQFEHQCSIMEEAWPALKEMRTPEGKPWTETLREEVCDTYKLKLALTTPYDMAIKKLTRQGILSEAARNQEKPFGFVIDWLKDNFGMPKTEGWDIAGKVLEYFNIDNEAPISEF